jgi:hypothetical protein
MINHTTYEWSCYIGNETNSTDILHFELVLVFIKMFWLNTDEWESKITKYELREHYNCNIDPKLLLFLKLNWAYATEAKTSVAAKCQRLQGGICSRSKDQCFCKVPKATLDSPIHELCSPIREGNLI